MPRAKLTILAPMLLLAYAVAPPAAAGDRVRVSLGSAEAAGDVEVWVGEESGFQGGDALSFTPSRGGGLTFGLAADGGGLASGLREDAPGTVTPDRSLSLGIGYAGESWRLGLAWSREAFARAGALGSADSSCGPSGGRGCEIDTYVLGGAYAAGPGIWLDATLGLSRIDGPAEDRSTSFMVGTRLNF